MKKAYYITQHTKPLPMHTVKAKFVHSTADTKRFSFQSKKSHTFYKKNNSRKFHPFLTEKILHIGRPKLYTTINTKFYCTLLYIACCTIHYLIYHII